MCFFFFFWQQRGRVGIRPKVGYVLDFGAMGKSKAAALVAKLKSDGYESVQQGYLKVR
jgi:hypothetical protein